MPATSTRPPVPVSPTIVPMPLRLIDRRPKKSVWVFLSVWAVFWSILESVGGLYSWHYFATGGTALLNPGTPGGGWHVYAAHPDLQMGPLTLLIAAIVVAVSGPLNALVGALIMTALGALNLKLLLDVRAYLRHQETSPRSTLYGGFVFIPCWSVLSVHYGHLDDVLALTLTTGAIVAAAHRRPWLTVVLLAAATGAKPWALPFAVLLLLHPVGRTRRLLAYLGLFALPWLPFLLTDHNTTSISSFTILNAPDSALRALGVNAAQTPSWDRAAQILLAVAIGVWCVYIGRPFAIPAVALTVRLLLDPGTYPYYTAGLLLACLYLDLTHTRRHIPWTAAAVFTWFVLDGAAHAILPATVIGALRAIFLTILLLTLCTRRPRWIIRPHRTHPLQQWHAPLPHPTADQSKPATTASSPTAKKTTPWAPQHNDTRFPMR